MFVLQYVSDKLEFANLQSKQICINKQTCKRAAPPIWRNLRGILCSSFGEKTWSGHVRSRRYDVISGTTSKRFFEKWHRLC